ncbi:ty3-gypsy retrotransposon protein [Cucumis melo var. makuwa]|uniref:Ty3-gypsy retrotransposon protein n=1 Tax=Cucumis melo var. makuwa TaxID=1194695 RepID=A0A5A7UQN9_CUCMM|nr:ty3-gypsy retrotransposon protein [Cucumis melo var. makuwa]
MALRKVASKATVANDSYTGLITHSHSKRSRQEQEQSSVLLKKKSWEQLIKSPKGGSIIRETPLFNNSMPTSNLSDKESHVEVMSVMMTDVIAEATVVEMERKINFLTKVVEERDHEIVALKDQMRLVKLLSRAKLLLSKLTKKEKFSIRAQYGGPPQTSFMYSKPYTKRINDLRMPVGIKRRPTSQIVRSKCKRNAFEWYTDLEPKVIDSWEQLKIEFLISFYTTRHVVSMMELTNTKQQKEEPVINYINRWRAISLDCKDKFTKLSAVEICTQEYCLQGSKAFLGSKNEK